MFSCLWNNLVLGTLGVADFLTVDTSARIGKVIEDFSLISKLEQLIFFKFQK